MSALKLIQGKQQAISLHEQIAQQMVRLAESNKRYCLDLIMGLEAEERLFFLNAYMVALSSLPAAAQVAAA